MVIRAKYNCIFHYKIRLGFSLPFECKKKCLSFSPSAAQLVSFLNPFYPKCVSQHRTLASLGSLLAMQNLRQYSRST